MRRFLTRRNLVIAAIVVLAMPALIVGGSVAWVWLSASGHVYDADDVPARPVALVFGAQVYSDGRPSPYLAGRLELARRLYVAGKVRAILVSGDNGQEQYNEVDPMRRHLIDAGVPATKVVGDYAGFDSYSTCVRAVKVFGVRQAIVVTQGFHAPRAVALCRRVGLDAVGVGDDSQDRNGVYAKNLIREQLACVKAAWEALTRPRPRYLGPHEKGIDDALG